jgi:hypothetical protein
VESLRASGVLVDFLAKLKLARPTVVAPNEECIQLAMDVRTGLQHKLPRRLAHVGLAVEDAADGLERDARLARHIDDRCGPAVMRVDGRSPG